MERDLAQWVYDSLMGSLVSECRCVGVEDLFEAGKPCEILYGQMLDAYWRLCNRLGESEAEADEDGEIMINSLMEITRIVGQKMFEYGQLYCDK